MTTHRANQSFITGPAKVVVYAWIAVHVAGHFARRALTGSMPWRAYPAFLYRALVFLVALRHSKVVRRGGLVKLHLYVPAYPTRAFFHVLEKFYRPDPGPATVVLSMTRACTYRCPHCYQQKDSGRDLPMDVLVDSARAMQEAGVAMFDIEGGEPLMRIDRLVGLMEALDDRAAKWVNTTGAGLTGEKIDRMVAAGLTGVMVSIHSPRAESHDEFTGVPGAFASACEALRLFGERGVFTAVNCCPTAEAVTGGDLDALIALAGELNCSFVQVIHPKSAGGWLGRDNSPAGSDHVLARLCEAHLRYNSGGKFRNTPSVSSQVFEEAPAMFGCTAGGVDRFYMGADGEVQPCEFVNVSFGNVRDEPFETILRRMREHLPTPCTDWLCCTQAESIDRAIADGGLTRTPIPWEITRGLVARWRRAEPTRLYRRLGIYKAR